MLEILHKLQLLGLITASSQFIQLGGHLGEISLGFFESANLRLNPHDFHFDALFLAFDVGLELVHPCPGADCTRVGYVGN